ncbi:unnamed protein product [Cyclocybe aegerita]|uniref:Uncharacterized protein n=1 Tax=Cyclocybe aegerita TaxID=1973307 RepID=A0A8S0WIQ3_CYCAE|nr:unnamed protein product [Cyclocybe aegerita]
MEVVNTSRSPGRSSTVSRNFKALVEVGEIGEASPPKDDEPATDGGIAGEWFEADDLCRITFVYVPSALRWDIHGEAHKYVTELKVRVGHRKTDNSIDALRSQAAHSVLDSWSSTFQDPTYRGSEFLELQQPDRRPLQPSYLNGGPWLSTFGHSITEFARVCQCITGHAPIGAPVSIFSFAVAIATPCITPGDIASFMKYNPTAFGFNRDPSGVG